MSEELQKAYEKNEKSFNSAFPTILLTEPRENMEQSSKYEWFKKNPDDKIWWLDNPEVKGEWLFSFDKETKFNMFRDYPHELTDEQKQIFDEENPYWADFFKDRT